MSPVLAALHYAVIGVLAGFLWLDCWVEAALNTDDRWYAVVLTWLGAASAGTFTASLWMIDVVVA